MVEPGEVMWEGTATFRDLDRPVARWLRELRGGEADTSRLKHLSVGKCVLERRREGRKESTYVLSRAALRYFDNDGVYLSPDGYERIVAKPDWPSWLRLGRAERPQSPRQSVRTAGGVRPECCNYVVCRYVCPALIQFLFLVGVYPVWGGGEECWDAVPLIRP